MKSKYWIMLICALFLLAAATSIPLLRPSEPSHQAQILSGGELNRTVNLALDQEFTVPCPGGYNTVTVKNGKIAVTGASCPDQYCVQRMFCDSGTPIVCLPNKLVIEFLGENEIDGKIG